MNSFPCDHNTNFFNKNAVNHTTNYGGGGGGTIWQKGSYDIAVQSETNQS